MTKRKKKAFKRDLNVTIWAFHPHVLIDAYRKRGDVWRRRYEEERRSREYLERGIVQVLTKHLLSHIKDEP